MKSVARTVRLALLFAPVSALSLAVGCQAGDKKPETMPSMKASDKPELPMAVAPTTMPGATHTITKDSMYYMSSPAQAKAPDGMLKKDSQVKVMMPSSGSHTKVEIGNKMSVWVPTDSLKPM